MPGWNAWQLPSVSPRNWPGLQDPGMMGRHDAWTHVWWCPSNVSSAPFQRRLRAEGLRVSSFFFFFSLCGEVSSWQTVPKKEPRDASEPFLITSWRKKPQYHLFQKGLGQILCKRRKLLLLKPNMVVRVSNPSPQEAVEEGLWVQG
jgi:hypothetical protein